MTTKNHPAHGPVSLDRLHQIREILSKAAAQSDGGNLGYAMADAVKVIDGAIAEFCAEPAAWFTMQKEFCDDERTVITNSIEAEKYSAQCYDLTPLYTAQPAPVSVHDEYAIFEAAIDICRKSDAIDEHAWNHGVLAVMSAFRACRAAMLQAGNSPATPDGWCHTCRPVTMSDMRFVVCHDCGNKRCPHANDHRHACTGSNEPGQEGSAYQAAPQQEVKRG